MSDPKIIYTFPVVERYREEKNDFEVEVKADSDREAIIAAALEVLHARDAEIEYLDDAERVINDQLGLGWTADDFYRRQPELWADGGVYIYELKRPVRVCAEDDTPSAVMARCVERYGEQGMLDHLRGRLLHVVNSLSDSEVEALFAEDIHAQRGLEKEVAVG